MFGSVIGVALWLMSTVLSTGVDASATTTTNSNGDIYEAAVGFDDMATWTVPSSLAVAESEPTFFAMIEWEDAACVYQRRGRQYHFAVCSDGSTPGTELTTNHLAAWVRSKAYRPSPGNIFIDFMGGGVFVSCSGHAKYLGDIDVANIVYSDYCD